MITLNTSTAVQWIPTSIHYIVHWPIFQSISQSMTYLCNNIKDYTGSQKMLHFDYFKICGNDILIQTIMLSHVSQLI